MLNNKQLYCEECGTKLMEKYLEHEGIIPFCVKCNEYRFPKYNVAVSMIVIDKKTNKILLIQQYNKSKYILVAGYVSLGESCEEAVIREIKEEIGLEVSNFKFNKTKYFKPSNTLMCNYTVFVEDGSLINSNYEIDKYTWFSYAEARNNIYPGSLASEFLNKYLDENK